MKKLLFALFLIPSILFAQPSIDSLCTGVQNLQGQIDCFPFAPNQGQLQVMWTIVEPNCNPVGFYRGDDLNDIEVLKVVGLSALTINRPIKNKLDVDYITKRKGGDGAFREFVDLILITLTNYSLF